MLSFSALLIFLCTVVLSTITIAGVPYCLPGDKCFPSGTELQVFNNSINGKLIKNEPYGSACYKSNYNANICMEQVTNKHSYPHQLSLPAGVMYTSWEQTEKGEGCPVPELPANASPLSPLEGNCTLGGMSSYSVKTLAVDDITMTVKFARKHNLRFRIKNTGHDYTGHVLAIGPGANVEEVYAAGARNGVVLAAGYTASVGAGGGYVLGGGIGPLGNYFGLAVDNVVQFDVVTADGSTETVNECTNPDLFWALRGGGGTLAVTTRTYFKTYPSFSAVSTAVGQIKCTQRSAWTTLITKLIASQVSLRKAGLAGIWQSNSGTLSLALIYLQPSFTNPATELSTFFNLIKPFLSIPSCATQVKPTQFVGNTSWNDAYRQAILPLITAAAPGGLNIIDGSRLISNKLVSSETELRSVTDYVVNLDPNVNFIWQNSVGTASNKIAPNATSVHPDWRTAFAFMDIAVTGPWSGTTPSQISIAKKALEDADSVFGETAFSNEAWILEKNWQRQFWGENYERLVKIKRDVDPCGLFNCRRCVGSEEGF
ncbi:hypothetical protein B0J11DRAFT_587266 [Dendryphion nanum]|uniref:FAD-binding PCMH-type domain-containing protein n=1 Tax=Dendryphion nanum TaxID=256645 RepID=A0A9P9J1P1_9PLEO|nr:hypothetical protein B0J11DRAFT_587266 [Dendryphion nanum]